VLDVKMDEFVSAKKRQNPKKKKNRPILSDFFILHFPIF